jgi:hypothetical protein
LFSSEPVANSINNAFEPVWESVRPVPIVTIDFGNGHTITRTLHGNIATYLCDADGTVFDILPGIYDPDAYRKQLEQFALLHRHAGQEFAPKTAPRDAADWKQQLAAHIDTRLKQYHEHQARLLNSNQPADVLVRKLNGGRGKALIEMRVELIVAGAVENDASRQPPSEQLGALPVPALGAQLAPPDPEPVPTKVADIAGWKELVEDTRINETVRRRAIHEKLAAAGRVKPQDIKNWLFKEVLAADLDDPYLGLQEILNRQYPFAGEDVAGKK